MTPKVELQNVLNAVVLYFLALFLGADGDIFWTSLQLLLRTENDVRIESEGI